MGARALRGFASRSFPVPTRFQPRRKIQGRGHENLRARAPALVLLRVLPTRRRPLCVVAASSSRARSGSSPCSAQHRSTDAVGDGERRCSEVRCGRSGCVRAQMGRMAEHVHPARVRPSSSSSGPARARKAPRNAECALGGPLSLSLSFACGQSRGARCGLVAALPVLRVRVHALGRPRRPPLDPASRACLCAPLGQRAVFEGRMRGEPAVGSSQAALPCF